VIVLSERHLHRRLLESVAYATPSEFTRGSEMRRTGGRSRLDSLAQCQGCRASPRGRPPPSLRLARSGIDTGPARPRATLMARTSTGDTQSQQATKPAAPRTSERPGFSPADAIRNGSIEARRTRLARVYCGPPPPPSTSQGSVS
jgi:hypothetical protein